MAPLIEFPSSPVFAAPRKRGARSSHEITAPITSYRVELIEDVRLNIYSAWRRGVQLAWIAKMFQLTVGQAQYVIWCEDRAAHELRRAA